MHPHRFSMPLAAALTIVLLSLTMASTASAAEYKVLYKFTGGVDGAQPSSELILDAAGNLFGTTSQGGAYDNGTVFKLTPNPDGSWTETVLYSLGTGYADGHHPNGSLIFDATGNLYGTTVYGGRYNQGAVFKLKPNPDGRWAHTVLHSFSGGDGYWPYAGLILDPAGNLYGTTMTGGDFLDGNVFELIPNPDGSWSAVVLYSFSGSDGFFPKAPLIFGAAGDLFGTTSIGGAHGKGAVFKLTPNPDGTWNESVIHSFNGKDGSSPGSGVISDAAGNLCGTTINGGSYGKGTAFQLTPQPDGTWKRSRLHLFKGTDGAHPYAGLIFDAAGNLYGTTYGGGAYKAGTVFKLTPNPDGGRRWSKVHIFKGADGSRPLSGLVLDAAGHLYGTAATGGKMTRCGGKGCGVVFRITP